MRRGLPLVLVLLPALACHAFLRPSAPSSSSSPPSPQLPSLATSSGGGPWDRRQQQPPPLPAKGASAGNDSKGSGASSSSNGGRKQPPLFATPPPAKPRAAWPRPTSSSSSASASSSSSKKPAPGTATAKTTTGLRKSGAGPAPFPSTKKQEQQPAARAPRPGPPPAAGAKAAGGAGTLRKPTTRAAQEPDPQVFPKSILPPKVKPTRLVISEPKQGLWVFEQPFVLGVTDVRNRMSVLRLSNGGFAVFSPLAATPECVRLLRELVKKERLSLDSAYFIAPSSYPEHHESLAAWREAIPEARVVSVTARVNVIVEHLLEGEDPLAAKPSVLPPALAKDLDVGLLEAPLLRELIVCHRASRTLLVADSGFFISEAYIDSGLQRWFTKSQGIYDRFVTPPFFRLGANTRTGRPLYQRALGWDFDRIVTCHADMVPMGQGKAAFREGYAHLK